MKVAVFLCVALAAGACGRKPEPGTGAGTGTGTGRTSDCADVRGHVEALYRAEAEALAAADDQANVEEMVADNTTMVMNDCAAQPDRVAPCAAAATTVAALEADCLIPLDEEGSEGDHLLPSPP